MTIQEATLGDTPSGSRLSSRLLWVPLVSMWLLLSASFTLPGRTGAESFDSIDALALFKVGVRGLVFAALALAILRLRRSGTRAAGPRGFVPLGIFVLWCLVSCLWSPLPAFSVGEALTLFTLFLLAVALALVWQTSGDTSAVLGQLSVAFLLICAGLLAVYAVNPELSGLERSSDRLGAVGLLHPTKVGATASLGLVLVVACRLIWNWRWTRVLLLPSLVVFPVVLLLAASRMALGLTIVLTGLMVCTWGHRRWLATLLLVVSLGGIMYPLADPELEAARHAVGASTDFALRGESVDELRTLTGRTELWTALHKSFLQAPLVGHGYFVTSETGKLEVWSRSTNILAHNLLLQVAVSTGLVGLTLFLVGLWRPVAAGCRRLGLTSEGRRLRTAAAVLGAWYLGWGLLSESFMGALSPEAVLAFSLLGLVAGARGPEAQ